MRSSNQACVRSKLYRVYGKVSKANGEKVYAVIAGNILVWNYVSPVRLGRHIVCVFTVFSPPICPYGCLSVTKSCPFYSLKPFNAFLWNLIQIKTSSDDMQIERLIKRLYTFLELRLLNVLNSVFLSQYPVHCIIWKPLYFHDTLHQYKSSSDHVQSLPYDYTSFFLSFFLSF